jgi:hypothetical protein
MSNAHRYSEPLLSLRLLLPPRLPSLSPPPPPPSKNPLRSPPTGPLPANKSCNRSASSFPVDSGLRFPSLSKRGGKSVVLSESSSASGGARSYLSLKSCEAGSRVLRPRRWGFRLLERCCWDVTVSSESEWEWRSRELARRCCSWGNSMFDSRSNWTRLLEREWAVEAGAVDDCGLIRPSVVGEAG